MLARQCLPRLESLKFQLASCASRFQFSLGFLKPARMKVYLSIFLQSTEVSNFGDNFETVGVLIDVPVFGLMEFRVG